MSNELEMMGKHIEDQTRLITELRQELDRNKAAVKVARQAFRALLDKYEFDTKHPVEGIVKNAIKEVDNWVD